MNTPTEGQPANNGTGSAETGAAASQVGNPAPTSASNGSALSSLLNEYESKTTQITAADLGRVVKAIEPIATHIQHDFEAKAQAKLQADIDHAVSVTKGDLPDAWKTAARGHIEGLVATKQDFKEAWENREKTPDVWNGKLAQARDEFGQLVKPSSAQGSDVRTDLDRAAASVKNLSTDPPKLERPDPIAHMNMSDRDWAAYKLRVEAASQSG